MSSLEGLNSLIQLESTRLEGARQTTQNFQSVGSTVQQQGIQTAQSRMNMMIQRIDAEYTRECALADVRKLERTLARERAAEALAKNIACIATISNAVGNLGHLFNDLNGRQKLGDTPEYLKSPELDPKDTKLSITQLPTGANTVYLSGENKDGSETVYRYDTGNGGDTVSSMPMAATITEYDKERILGDEYPKMINDYNKKNGTSLTSLTFEQMHQMSPDLADHLIQTRGHGVTQDEAKNLVDLTDALIKPEKTSTIRPNSSQLQQQGIGNAEKLAKVFEITAKQNSDPAAISKLANIASITNFEPPIFKDMTTKEIEDKIKQDPALIDKVFASDSFKSKLISNFNSANPVLSTSLDKFSKGKDAKFTDDEISEMNKNMTKEDKVRIFGKENEGKELKDLLSDPQNIKALTSDKIVSEKFQKLTVPVPTLVKKNANGNEDVQYSDNGLFINVNDISADDKEKILGDKKYRMMSFNDILSKEPDVAKQLISGMLEKEFSNMKVEEKEAFLKKYPEIMQTTPDKNRFGKLDNKTQKELKDKYGFDGSNFDSLQVDKKEALKKEHPELFFKPDGMMTSLISSDPKSANNAIGDISKVSNGRVSSLTQQQAKDNIDKAGLMKNIDISKQSLRGYLGKQGKIDDKSFMQHLNENAKHGMNFLVKTMEESAPYFQAYLKMKEQADKTYEELQAAIDKLNAASRKLRKLEMQIDEFSGRGA